MRRILIVLGCLAVLGGIGGGVAFYFTRGAVAAADGFLQAYASGGADAAYGLTAPAFRRDVAEAKFAAAGERLGLRLYRESHWLSRSVSGGMASVEGTIGTSDGGAVPLHIDLVKTDSGWRVIGLSTPHGEDRAEPPAAAAPPVPAGAALAQLVQVTFQRLAEAIVSGNFSAVQLSAPAAVRGELSPEKLRAGFKFFIDNHIDLTRVSYGAPVFEGAPIVDGNGQLIAKGHFPASPHPWYFVFKYLPDSGEWAPVGYDISATAP